MNAPITDGHLVQYYEKEGFLPDALLNYLAVELPMGGWKASGIGTRHGAAGIRKYAKQQALLVSRFHLKREPFMFPYRPASSKLLFRAV